MGNWRKFRRLSTEERKLFLAAAAVLPLVRLGLKTLGWKRVAGILNGNADPVPALSSGGGCMQARRAARLVAVAARFAGGTCLAQSLVLAWLLERRGIQADLRIGVRKNGRGIEAHAWVEAGGVVLNDGQDITERFAAFDRSFAPARVSWR